MLSKISDRSSGSDKRGFSKDANYKSSIHEEHSYAYIRDLEGSKNGGLKLMKEFNTSNDKVARFAVMKVHSNGRWMTQEKRREVC